jgi:Family of unknown function (DUF5677)
VAHRLVDHDWSSLDASIALMREIGAAGGGRPEVVSAFEPQFAACDALYAFARSHRPGQPPSEPAAALIVATYARGSKTYQGGLRLAYLGYGAQSFMLGRSLWEDMLVAHWIKLNPKHALRQLDDHRRLTLAVYAGELRRFGLEVPDQAPIDREERDRLRKEFGSRHWTKLSMDKLRRAVESEFPEQDGHRRLLGQVDALLHRHANLIVHNSFLSLGGAVASTAGHGITYDVGVSSRFIRQALFIAFLSYIHLTSLVLGDSAQQELARLWHKHRDAFTVTRTTEADSAASS